MKREGDKAGNYWDSMRYARKSLLLLFFAIVTTGLLLPGFAKASEGYGPGQDKWKFELGAYFPSISTTVKLDGSEVGDNVDLENGLGLDEDDTVWRLDGYWRFFKKHRLGFGYYQLKRDATRRLDEQFYIGDKLFEVGAMTSTELKMGFYSIDYLYSFYQGEKWEISGGLGAYWVDLEFSVQATADINGELLADFLEKTDFNGPLPYLLLSFDYYITPKWLVILKGGYFQLKVGDIDGKLSNIGAKLEYQFTQRFGLGLGYDAFRIDVDIEDSDLRSNIEYNYQGIQLYGVLRF